MTYHMTADLDHELIRVTGGTVQNVNGMLHAAADDWFEPLAKITDTRKLVASLKTMPDYGGDFDPDAALVRFIVGMLNGLNEVR